MSAGQTLEFDFAAASNLGKTIKGEIETLNATLNNIERQKVESVREWWKGGSEEAFIKNFATTKKKVSTALKNWLEEYEKLVKEVAKEKEKQDKELSDALKI